MQWTFIVGIEGIRNRQGNLVSFPFMWWKHKSWFSHWTFSLVILKLYKWPIMCWLTKVNGRTKNSLKGRRLILFYQQHYIKTEIRERERERESEREIERDVVPVYLAFSFSSVGWKKRQKRICVPGLMGRYSDFANQFVFRTFQLACLLSLKVLQKSFQILWPTDS